MSHRRDLPPDPFVGRRGRVQEPKRMETVATTVYTEMQQRSRCRLAAVPQNLSNGTALPLAFTVETFDIGGLHDPANNTRITIPGSSGQRAWLFIGQVVFDVNATGARTVTLRQNGVTPVQQQLLPAVSGAPTAIQIVGLLDDVQPGDYFELVATQTSGGTLAATLAFFQATALW